MQNETLTLAAHLIEAMIEHARNELPNECCGVLIGRHGVFERAIPITSIHPSPDSYFMSPEEQIEIFTELGTSGESFLGIYHSHPDGPAFPSGMDLKLAFHPEAVYLIISLKDRNHPEVRAYRIERENLSEILINITAG